MERIVIGLSCCPAGWRFIVHEQPERWIKTSYCVTVFDILGVSYVVGGSSYPELTPCSCFLVQGRSQLGRLAAYFPDGVNVCSYDARNHHACVLSIRRAVTALLALARRDGHELVVVRGDDLG